jgi:2-polyprenyl-6-methoxyphenol hydroxylase-like FAD-dependent oxidoreductase
MTVADTTAGARPSEDAQVVVVGAGPTGLNLAIWLTRLGVPLRIIDKNAEPPQESRAFGVQARTLEFYRQLGIADEVVAGAEEIGGINLWPAARPPTSRSRTPSRD